MLSGALMLATVNAGSYPVDAYEETGIGRLEGYRLITEGKLRGNPLPPGARLTRDQIRLQLVSRPEFVIPAPDKVLTDRIAKLLGDAAEHTSVSVLDLSDPAAPVYAEHRGGVHYNPASVGKLMVAVGLFQALADRYPDDLLAREELLRDTPVVAGRLIRYDTHDVPFWLPERNRLVHRPLREGDTANLWTYLDWMLSASSNAAASTVIEQAMLLNRFGDQYPPGAEAARTLFYETPSSERSALLHDTLIAPLDRNGLDSSRLRQGAFFTYEGRRRVPGTTSASTVRELMRLLVMLERGELVDEWSSLEIKRLLYLTQKRIRYASAPALQDAAVYFKSGSLYKCKPGPTDCPDYQGSQYNYMNSVAIVEWPAGEPRLVYLVALTSNVLNENAAVAHQTFATRLHALLKARHSAPAAP